MSGKTPSLWVTASAANQAFRAAIELSKLFATLRRQPEENGFIERDVLTTMSKRTMAAVSLNHECVFASRCCLF